MKVLSGSITKHNLWNKCLGSYCGPIIDGGSLWKYPFNIYSVPTVYQALSGSSRLSSWRAVTVAYRCFHSLHLAWCTEHGRDQTSLVNEQERETEVPAFQGLTSL